ncbi:MAG: trypsin-like peptidase domain-containing protein [Gemmataceae bacterium]
MRPFSQAFVLGISIVVTALGQEPSGSDLLRTLKTRAAQVIEEARPSVVCILVSRSDAYARAPFWGVEPTTTLDGALGRFDATEAARLVPTDAPHRQRILRTIQQHDLSDPTTVPESYGSGFVVDRTGLILTNAHVVRNATRIFVRLPGKKGSWADILASDPRSDLAILKLLDPPGELHALPLGDGGTVRTGQFVISLANSYAPGFPASDEATAGHGLISNLRRRIPGNTSEMERSKITLHHYGTLIQTDAATTPGCSGGALLNLDGKVIGMTTALAAIRGDRPGGFAIPFDASTRRIIDVLKKGEEVEYGFLGVVLGNPGGGGVRVTRVSPGSPAARSGLVAGDLIVGINGNAIRDSDDLFLHVGMALAGQTARVEVARGLGGATRTFPVKLAKFYVAGPIIAAKRPPSRFGLRVDYASILSQRNPFFAMSRTPSEGVIIREVVPGSSADKARLQPDKVITQVNDRPIATPEDYYREIARAGKSVELTFLNSEGRSEKLTLEDK